MEGRRKEGKEGEGREGGDERREEIYTWLWVLYGLASAVSKRI